MTVVILIGLQLSLELGFLVTSHVYFTLSISEVIFDQAYVTLKGQRSICPRAVDTIAALAE